MKHSWQKWLRGAAGSVAVAVAMAATPVSAATLVKEVDGARLTVPVPDHFCQSEKNAPKVTEQMRLIGAFFACEDVYSGEARTISRAVVLSAPLSQNGVVKGESARAFKKALVGDPSQVVTYQNLVAKLGTTETTAVEWTSRQKQFVSEFLLGTGPWAEYRGSMIVHNDNTVTLQLATVTVIEQRAVVVRFDYRTDDLTKMEGVAQDLMSYVRNLEVANGGEGFPWYTDLPTWIVPVAGTGLLVIILGLGVMVIGGRRSDDEEEEEQPVEKLAVAKAPDRSARLFEVAEEAEREVSSDAPKTDAPGGTEEPVTGESR